MKAEDFVSYFNGSQTEINLKGENIHDEIILNTDNFKHNGDVNISQFTFKSPVTLESISLNKIKFDECVFEGGLYLNSITRTPNRSEFLFKSCTIQILRLNKCNMESSITISKCNIDSLHILNDCQLRCVKILENKSIRDLYVTHSKVINFNIENNESINRITLSTESQIEVLNLRQNKIDKTLKISSIDNRKITLEENRFTEYFSIEKLKSCDLIELKNNNTNDYCTIELNNTSSIRLTGGSNACGLKVKKGENHNQPCKIEMKCNDETKGSFSFEGLLVTSFELSGTVRNTEINLDSLKAESLNFKDVNNYGQITISDIHPYADCSKINLFKSTLGNLTLFNCDLNRFNSIIIDSVQLTDVKAIQTNWFNPSKLNNEDNLTTRKTISNREIYRQLKLAMTAQADNIQALEFKSLEMAEYLKELKSKPIKNWNECSDVILMFLNGSNSYGINWMKSALLTLAFASFSYTAMSFVHYSNNFQILNPECGIFINYLIYTWQNKTRFFQLLEPTFKVSEVFGLTSNLTFGLYTLAILSKIGVAYLIIQTIAAFRKYLK